VIEILKKFSSPFHLKFTAKKAGGGKAHQSFLGCGLRRIAIRWRSASSIQTKFQNCFLDCDSSRFEAKSL
jgi:hypothetical protein